MISRYESAVACVLREGEIVGAAFLVAERHLLTCAHVVEPAAGRYELVFLANPDAGPIAARVAVTTNPESLDVAVLAVDSPAAGARPVSLAHGARGDAFFAVGFPAHRGTGTDAQGVLRGATLDQKVELECHGNRPITRRFSGTAVWCEARKAVVGMVESYYDDTPTAYMIPVRRLAEILERCAAGACPEVCPPFRRLLADDAEREPTGPAFAIPSLLPYLADRSDQRDDLGRALAAAADGRPLVIVVHGDEREAHDRFVERLWEKDLPDLLELDEPVRHTSFEWRAAAGSVAERLERLRRELADEMVERRGAGHGELLEVVKAHPSPYLISTYLLISDWQKNEAELIAAWLRGWAAWTPFVPCRRLVVVFSLRYESPGEPEHVGWLGRLGGRRPPKERRNAAARELIAALPEQLAAVEGISGVVLSELRGVRKSEVNRWIERDVARFCRAAGRRLDHVQVAEALKQRLSALFERREAVAMRELAPILRDELKLATRGR